MEYLIVTFLQIVGICFSIRDKAIEVDKRTPDDTFTQVVGVILRENAIVLFYSGVILSLNLILYYILDEYTDLPVLAEDSEQPWYIKYYVLIHFGVAIVAGYGGQALLTKALGKSVDYLSNKVDEKLR